MMELSRRLEVSVDSTLKWEKVDVKKVGNHTSWPWKFSETRGAGETRFDERLKAQVSNKLQESCMDGVSS